MKTNPIQKLIVIVTILLGINYSNAQTQTIWEGCATATYSVTNTPGSTYAWSVTPSVVTISGNTNAIGIDWTGGGNWKLYSFGYRNK